MEAVEIKAWIVSHGIRISKSALDAFGLPYLEKRRAYGIQDPGRFLHTPIPQELFLLPKRLVCSVNIKDDSPWLLEFNPTNGYFVSNGTHLCPVTFLRRPLYYSSKQEVSGRKLNQYFTLYGGSALGAFLSRSCVFHGKTGCHYCSLDNNTENADNYAQLIKPTELHAALEEILKENYPFGSVMLNGGTTGNLDDSFRFYVKQAKSALDAVEKSGRSIPVHLITAPPRNLELLNLLKGLNIRIAMDSEVADDSLYQKYCPGKSRAVPKRHLFAALKRCVDILGTGNACSVFVGGLEPVSSLSNGMRQLAEIGVAPVVNVLHVDPNTKIANDLIPSAEAVLEMGSALQELYLEYGFEPFYRDCGRNSLDDEASLGLFPLHGTA